MRVNLVYMAQARTGGWVSFTAHLMHGLLQAGHTPYLYKITKRIESHTRSFGMGFEYQNMSQAGLEYLADSPDPMIVVCCWHTFADQLGPLVDKGAHLVVHDPAEIKRAPVLAEVADRVRPGRLVVIRPVMLKHLPNALLVPHPYQRAPRLQRNVAMHAVSYARLDYDKHTEIVAGANAKLPLARQVHIYGSDFNRIYMYHQLDHKFPGWRKRYYGAMPRTDLWAGARLAAKAGQVVDMSVIVNDGGGTQYTFLEALDAATPLIVHSRWMTGVPEYDVMAPYAHTAGTADELADLLQSDLPQLPGDPVELLAKHNAAEVARTILDAR